MCNDWWSNTYLVKKCHCTIDVAKQLEHIKPGLRHFLHKVRHSRESMQKEETYEIWVFDSGDCGGGERTGWMGKLGLQQEER